MYINTSGWLQLKQRLYSLEKSGISCLERPRETTKGLGLNNHLTVGIRKKKICTKQNRYQLALLNYPQERDRSVSRTLLVNNHSKKRYILHPQVCEILKSQVSTKELLNAVSNLPTVSTSQYKSDLTGQI